MVALDIDTDLSRRIVAEYREMPGLRLTVPQAARLWAMDRRRCQCTLDALVAQGLLARTTGGEYCTTADAQWSRRSSTPHRFSARGGRS